MDDSFKSFLLACACNGSHESIHYKVVGDKGYCKDELIATGIKVLPSICKDQGTIGWELLLTLLTPCKYVKVDLTIKIDMVESKHEVKDGMLIPGVLYRLIYDQLDSDEMTEVGLNSCIVFYRDNVDRNNRKAVYERSASAFLLDELHKASKAYKLLTIAEFEHMVYCAVAVGHKKDKYLGLLESVKDKG